MNIKFQMFICIKEMPWKQLLIKINHNKSCINRHKGHHWRNFTF